MTLLEEPSPVDLDAPAPRELDPDKLRALAAAESYRLLAEGAELPDLAALLARPAWMADAACREHPELSWFPGRGEDVRPAMAVCGGCLVRQECAAYAESLDRGADPLEGIWAGLSARRRRQARSRRVA